MYENTFSPPPTPPPPEVRHSKVGVASFILGIASLLFLCVGFLIAFGYGMSIGIQNPMNPQIDSSSPLILVASAVMCLAPLLSLVG
ncbi:MAG: hypothetical protein FJZ96_14740, partial [Chloroflexi bacterium]|nr:hypothetical protein [Chloroflexota bacterium]